MRETCRLVLVLLSTALPIAVHAQQQGTGLELLPPNEYILIPKAKEAVTGTGVAEKGLLGGTTGNDKLIFGPHANFENDMPSAQAQGDGSNACAAFAVTTNKAYRIYIASGRKGVPNDYLQSPSFPYSAACRRRAGATTLCAVAQSVLSKGPAHEFRQTRAHAQRGVDEHRGCHAGPLAGPLLGRKPVAGAAALEAVSPSGRHLGPFDLRPAGL